MGLLKFIMLGLFQSRNVCLLILESLLQFLVSSPCFLELCKLDVDLLPILFFFCLFAISWADPTAYGGSQARG